MAPAKTKDVPQPECLAMIVCDDVIEDKRTNKKTIYNAFNQIWSRKFPARHGKLAVFLSLTNGHGEVPFDLQFIGGAADKPLCGLKGTVKFPDPLTVVDMVLTMAGLPLPKEGVYAFRLLLGDRIARERRILVNLLKGGGDDAGD